MAVALVAVAFVIGSMPSQFESRADAQVVRALATTSSTLRCAISTATMTKLSQYRGHPVVIDFWATWCAPCRHQIPELKKLYSKYHQSRGLVVLGIACDTVQGDGVESVRPFVKEFDISYPILLAETAGARQLRRRSNTDHRYFSAPTARSSDA